MANRVQATNIAPIKAVYAGDTNFNVSTSAVLKHVISSSSDMVVSVAIAPSLVDQALIALGDETLTDALVADLTDVRLPVTRAKGAPRPHAGEGSPRNVKRRSNNPKTEPSKRFAIPWTSWLGSNPERKAL